MYNLKQTLTACGYTGPCQDLNLLKWALRAGASSQYFNDLVRWLELQLNSVTTTQNVRDNIRRLFCMLRHSVLMIPSYGSASARNPKEFRLQTLKVLARQLQLRKLPESSQYVEDKSLPMIQESTQSTHLAVTVEMRDNQRLVHF